MRANAAPFTGYQHFLLPLSHNAPRLAVIVSQPVTVLFTLELKFSVDSRLQLFTSSSTHRKQPQSVPAGSTQALRVLRALVVPLV